LLLGNTSKQTDKIQRAKEQIQGTQDDIAALRVKKARQRFQAPWKIQVGSYSL
jgi:hypothetical protein